MNAAQQFIALLMHGKLQSGGRDYKASHANQPTPPKLHANMRSTVIGGEMIRMTRGERKRLRRAVVRVQIANQGELPLRHQHPSYRTRRARRG